MRYQLTRRTMIISTSVLLSVGFLATSLSSYYVSRAKIRSSIINEELPITSDTIYSEIQRDLIRPVFISSMMAHDTFLRDWVLSGETNPELMKRYLQEIQVKYGTFTSFFVSDRTRIYYQAQGILKRVQESEPRDAWYYRVRDMNKDYEINVDPDLANQDAMTIFINYRVMDYRGNFIGAAGVGLTVEAVKRIIGSYQKRFDRNIFFADRGGRIVLSGNPRLQAGTSIDMIPGLKFMVPDILLGREHAFEYREGLTAHYLNVRFINELNWFLFVEKTDAEALAGIRSTLALNLIISALISLLIIGLTVTIIRHYQSRLEAMATTDVLTGLLNRRVFSLMLDQAIKDSIRFGDRMSVAVLDIDYFKRVNDTWGHLTGDRVLQHVAGVLRSQIRDSDILCRWGGEEFSIIFKNCGEEEAFAKCDAMRRVVSETPLYINDTSTAMTLSFGVAERDIEESTESVMERADRAMYRAKGNGRDSGFAARNL